MSDRRLFWTLQIAGWVIYGISSYLAFLPDVEGSYAVMALLKVVRTALGFGLSLVIWRILRFVRDRGAGVAAAMGAVAGCAAILGPVWLWLYWTTTLPLRSDEGFALDWSIFPHTSLDHAFVFLVWGTLYFGVGYWRDVEEERHRTAAARARAHEAELGMLRYQLNPHFLFNALASLRASIPREADESRRFVARIASFLRYALDTSDRNPVPLREELDAARDYLAVEQARWGDDLRVRIDADESVTDVDVPGFLLHPLVENAVKHGTASGATPLEVEIRARGQDGDAVIEVLNTVGSWDELESDVSADSELRRESGGVGLENVRRRLDAVFDGGTELTLHREPSRARVVLRLRGRFESGDARPGASGPGRGQG